MKYYLSTAIIFLLLSGCMSGGGVKEGSDTQGSPEQSQSAQGQNTQNQSAQGKQSSGTSYFTGDGGKGMSLAVLEPAGKGLSANEQWMLSLVQGSITGDFNRMSAMTIVDRQNLEKILADQKQSMSGEYSDENFISIGKLTNARFILTGSVSKTANNYMLELAVSDVESGVRKASYPPTPVSPAAMENLSAIREASAMLLEQLGVKLTDRALGELRTPLASAQVDAQASLAKGITAGKQGTMVAALNYFSESVSFDSSLAEANQRLDSLSRRIQSGDIGENIRNEIERRNAWKKLLEEAVAFYTAHPYVNLVYNIEPKMGKINYDKNTGQIVFTYWLEPNPGVNAVYKILKALHETGKREEWGLDDLRRDLMGGYDNGWYQMSIIAELLGENDVYLGRAEDKKRFIWQADLGAGFESFIKPGNGFLSMQGTSSLRFTVPADKIGSSLTLRFTQIGKESWRRQVPIVNAVANMRIIATDKSYEQYFAGRRGYRSASRYYFD